ncbi:MAG TPA: ATP-binding protein [Gammaproteobacteria bacterium]|nr:ATP-binding protein [Gammaproteobacteria bacterium]
MRLLFWLRIVAIAAQVAAVALANFVLAGPLPLRELGLAIGALALWNVLSYGPVHAARNVHDGEVVLHLAVDIVALTAVLYFTGGATNPFVSLYLVPISLAATSLPTRYAWLTVAICGAGYAFLWWDSVPLPPVHPRFGSEFDLHLAGMWVNFVIAAVLIVLFVGRMAWQVRQRDRELAAMRENALLDQQVIELGTLAAGTAHELNTPLSTLAILASELDETTTDAAQKRQLRTMLEEIRVINERLNRIAGGVNAERSAGARHVELDAFLEELLAQWAAAHREIELGVAFATQRNNVAVVVEATIEQAIRNVLDNAAHATLANGGRRIDVSIRVVGTRLELAVKDQGAGLDPAVRDDIGLKAVSTKEHGLGIGMLLSRAALQRFGGRLELNEAPRGGVEARIELPLDELLADAR